MTSQTKKHRHVQGTISKAGQYTRLVWGLFFLNVCILWPNTYKTISYTRYETTPIVFHSLPTRNCSIYCSCICCQSVHPKAILGPTDVPACRVTQRVLALMWTPSLSRAANENLDCWYVLVQLVSLLAPKPWMKNNEVWGTKMKM